MIMKSIKMHTNDNSLDQANVINTVYKNIN